MRQQPTSAMLMDSRVAVAALPAPTYAEAGAAVAQALAQAAHTLQWATAAHGPFGRMIPRGARVLVKPNLVLHENQGPWGLEPVITHLSLIRAVVEGVLRAEPAAVLVGDAPLQGCDFAQLLTVTGLGAWATALAAREPRFQGLRDFRRTTCVFENGVRKAQEGLQAEDQFVLFDLGQQSLLEPITDERDLFRVTCYDPRLLARTHARGRHQYLVAREVMEADVIINLPKLKTHKKAGITGALKNLIGINGNKEFLPHHRRGAAAIGGDCYPQNNPLKRIIEYTADREHTTASLTLAKVWHGVGQQFDRAARWLGDDLGTEGAWAGNDTIWRTCLDLNRILLYGRADATLAEQPQRQVLHVVDAIVAGQGEGPLAPAPLPLGLLLAGQNAAALDWVGAWLLGYDPERVPLVREAFGDFPWPLTAFAPEAVVCLCEGRFGPAKEVLQPGAPVLPPRGWRVMTAHDNY